MHDQRPRAELDEVRIAERLDDRMKVLLEQGQQGAPSDRRQTHQQAWLDELDDGAA